MDNILVSGLINTGTILRVDTFPLTYEPVRFPFFGVNSTVSGVGYNVANALTTLDNRVRFLSLIGTDFAGGLAQKFLSENRIADTFAIVGMAQTAQSVIIYDRAGKQQIHVDLRHMQE
ncbi:MAG: hypothetical protein GY803_01990 [Chloroflexi bacterium]|nr:hypothetical protein [Chloroflexota bacterium]